MASKSATADLILPEYLHTRLREVIAAQTGLSLTGNPVDDFQLRFAAAAKDAGAADALTYAKKLVSDPLSQNEIKTLARHFTVGETYFFRDHRSFDALGTHVLPALLRNREQAQRRLRIWSAGCCTGEEAYSIAILLDRLLPRQDNWDISLVATDINPSFLQKAEQATYGEWSFRGTPEWVRRDYFIRRKDNTYEVIPKIRERVRFSYLNLAEDVYPSVQTGTDRLDAIFCRNVLMYFSAGQARQVINRFRAALQEDGLLLVNPAESSTALFWDFSLVHYPGASFYQPSKALSGNTRLSRPLKRQPDRKRATKWVKAEENVLTQNLAVRSGSQSHLDSRPATTKAIKTAPDPVTVDSSLNRADGLAHLARTAADQGDLNKAAQLCEQAIGLNKLNPMFHYLLAVIEQERGQSEAASQALNRTLYLDQEFVLAHFALANLQLIGGRRKTTLRHLAVVRKLLRKHKADEVLSEFDGLTVGRLDDIAAALAASLEEPRHKTVI